MADATPAPSTPTKPYKSVAAFLVTLLGTLWASLEGRDTLSSMSLMEWLSIIVPTLLSTAAVYQVTNPAAHRRGIE